MCDDCECVFIYMCVLGHVLSACMLGGVGIRNRLRGKWTAGRREEEGREGGRDDVEAGQLWQQQQPVA